MKSPITGKNMDLVKEKRSLVFRKESFDIIHHRYLCSVSNESFTTTMLDEVNLNQVFNQYRDKYCIPFPDEIIKIRNKYGLSASKMSSILGFGINSYRQYEAGEMPSISNARLIQVINDPNKFIDMVLLCETLDEKAKNKYIFKAQSLIDDVNRDKMNANLKDYLLGGHLANINSGYRTPSLEKFTEMVVYFSEKLQPFKTKMNKLLFYSDFLMFKQSCFSISGFSYKAIEMGPVPNNFQSIFEFLANEEIIDISYTEFPQGYSGDQFLAKKNRPFRSSIFSEIELKVLEMVAFEFKATSTNDIIHLSHQEEAWIKNEKKRGVISYEYAFALSKF